MHTIPAHPLPDDLCPRTEYPPGRRYPRSSRWTQDSRCPYCVLAARGAAPSSSLVPLPLGSLVLSYRFAAPALKGQGRNPRSSSSPKAYVDRTHTVLFMSVLLSPLQDRLNTTDRSRTTSVVQFRLDKFVPPSLDIARSLSCSASRGSTPARQSSTHARAPVLTSLPLFPYFFPPLCTPLLPVLPGRLLLSTWPSISEKGRLHLPPVGIG